MATQSVYVDATEDMDGWIPPWTTDPAALPGRTDTLLSAPWRFLRADAEGAAQPSFDDSAAPWETISVPHTWNALDGQDGGHGQVRGDYYRGVGWYRIHWTPPADLTGRRVYLQFDAANLVADVYVNGQHLGQHRGGFAAFRFDATAAIAPGDNLLAVKVDNSSFLDIPPITGDFTFFGGLYRDVHVLDVADVHLDLDDAGSSGLYLTPSDVSASSATLRARVRVTNASEQEELAHVSVAVIDADSGAVIQLEADLPLEVGETGEATLEGHIDSPHRWDGLADPYLYSAVAQVSRDGEVVDSVAAALGFRSFEVDPDTGFTLNGHPLDLHGVNRHQDRSNLGWAIGKAEHDEDMALIREIGATALRLAHYQHAQYFYDLCDHEGLVVWAEIPLVDTITDDPAFRDNAQQQLRELIRQNYNHPSIFFWSIGNEQVNDDAPTNALLDTLAAEVRSEDPSRLSTYAHWSDVSDTGALVQHTDLSGYNKYFGWYEATCNDFGAWADSTHAARPTARIALSEYGAGAAVSQHQSPPQKPDPASDFHPEEYQAVFHEEHWAALSTRPYLWGKFVWAMFDFAADGRNEGETPGRNDKGLVSYDRQTKKDAFFFYKANWSTVPFVHITSQRFEPRPTATIDIKVYSNLPTVALRVNGVDLPAVSASDHIFRWPGVALQPGANQVHAVASGGSSAVVAANDTVTWTHTSAGPVTLVVTGNPGSGPYAVEAQTTLSEAPTVKFFVDDNFFHQEIVPKYSLFGGDASCATGTLGAGPHVIKAQVLRQGTTTVLAETQITVTE